MNKIAILPLNEIPNSCSECQFGNRFICKITKKHLSKNVNTWLTKTHPNCPLISIDIKELEEALETLAKRNDISNEIEFMTKKELEEHIKPYDILDDLTTKLGGNKK